MFPFFKAKFDYHDQHQRMTSFNGSYVKPGRTQVILSNSVQLRIKLLDTLFIIDGNGTGTAETLLQTFSQKPYITHKSESLHNCRHTSLQSPKIRFK